MAARANGYGAVNLTVAEGRVAAVQVTGGATFFPVSVLDGLFAHVVAAQSADVSIVTGATASWQDFTRAV